MKKQLFFIAMMLLGITSASASTAGHAVLNREDFSNSHYRFAEPIAFIERGVEFLIFPDGSFDFNTETFNNSTSVYYRRNTRRSSTNTTYGAPGTVRRTHYSNYGSPRGVVITHDSNGLVRRIGNVFINYDRRGRIKRAGSVYMSYQRGHHGTLRQVGGLRVNYNRWGQIVHTSGSVNRYNSNLEYGVGYGQESFGFNDIDDYDDDFYYYRKNGEIKKSKKRK